MRLTHGANLDVELLRAFSVVARSRTFTAAADRLGMSQPGLSRRIARLEAIVGAALILRHRGDLTLTAAGQELLPTADGVLRDLDDTISSLRARQEGLSGHVRISASTIPGEHLLPPRIAWFLRRHEQVGITLTIAPSTRVIEDVASGRADLGACGARSEQPGITYLPLARDTLVLVVPLGHPLAQRRRVTLQELEPFPMLGREPGSGTGRSTENLLGGRSDGLVHARPERSFGSTQAILAAVRAGIGIAVVSQVAASATPGVRSVMLTDVAPQRWLWIALPTAVPRPTEVAALVSHLQKERAERDPV